METENNGAPQEPVEINEEIIEVKAPWWKKALKVGGYVLSAVAGLVGGLLVSKVLGDDDEEDSPETESTSED